MIVFCASDAGPANYLSYLIKELNLPMLVFGSSISIPVFLKHGISAQPYDSEIIDKTVICAVLGTTLTKSAEKEIIKLSHNLSFKTISIVEHWTNYLERFRFDNEIELPDHILVNDYYASDHAVKEGIPEEIIVPLGNPVLESKSNMFINKKLCNKGNTILFISEQLHKNMPENNPRYLGFNQFDVLNDILNLTSQNQYIDLKLHPSEDEKEYNLYIKNNNIKIVSEDHMNKNLDKYSLVIGMESMLLIELAAAGICTYSYRPNSNRNFIGCEMNWVVDLKSKQLKNLLSNSISLNLPKTIKPNFEGSVKKINDWIKQIYENSSINSG